MAERKTTEQFIEKSITKHGNKYNYDLVDYTNAKTKVIIKCNTCNTIFEQSPSNHEYGFGCMACARTKQADSKRKDLEWFIKKAVEIHGDKYNYDNTEYIESDKKVSIECNFHGAFQQTPKAHLAKKGCVKCSRIYNSYIREDYVKMAKGRETTLYLIRCYNETECFYKIGKTYEGVTQRYRRKNSMPYNYEVIETFVSDAYTIHTKEVELHFKYGKYTYIPKITFGGWTECYSADLPIQEIIDLNKN